MSIIARTIMTMTLAACWAVGAHATSYYAAQNGQAPGDYLSWATAASNIQDAVNAANTNDTVWVGAGRYILPPNATNYIGPNVVYLSRPLTLRSSNSVPEQTIIDGEGVNRGIAVFYKTYTANRFVIDGFTISNCYATNMGGGILFNADNAATWDGVVQNCVVSDNTVAWGLNTGSFGNNAGSRGGGIGAYSFTVALNLTVSNCVVRNNRALSGPVAGNKSAGGGIEHAGQGLAVLKDCRVETNSADSGGGIHVSMSTLQANKCTISGNVAQNSGGGYTSGGGLCLNAPGRLAGGGVWVRNCLIRDNVSYSSGGGILYINAYTNLSIQNSTIVSNKITSGAGAGIYAKQNTPNAGLGFEAYNSIIYSNAPDNYSAGSTYTAARVWFMNCCINPTNVVGSEVFGSGNITNNPQFADYAAQNFRLARTSPCINAGIYQSWMTNAVDLDGNPRLDGGSPLNGVDMGCYEYVFLKGTLILVR